MVYYIDIGNSRLKIASYSPAGWQMVFQMETKDSLLAESLRNWLNGCKEGDVFHVVSVVPSVMQLVEGIITSTTVSAINSRVHTALGDENSEVPVSGNKQSHLSAKFELFRLSLNEIPADRIDYQTQQTLGLDRVLITLGAWNRYGKPAHSTCLCVSVGTAMTVDLVTREGVFKGGSIYPGIPVLEKGMQDVLPSLPEVAKHLPNRWPGQSTKEALEWGKVGLLCSAVIEDARKTEAFLGEAPLILCTGGDAGTLHTALKKMNAFDASRMIVDSWLLFEGMRFLRTDA